MRLVQILAVGLSVSTLLVGCGAPKSGGADALGFEPPQYDSARAFLTLDKIKPDPAPPKASETPMAELSAQSVRRLSRAEQLYRDQRFTEGSLELEKALRQDPNHPQLHRDLAKTLYAAGNVERARAHLNRAAEIDPNDVVTFYLLGRIAGEEGRNDEAARLLRTALKTANVTQQPAFGALVHFYLARALNAEGYLTAAISQYREYEKTAASLSAEQAQDPQLASLIQINHGHAGVPISVAYEKLGRYADAADALAGALKEQAGDDDAHDRLARLFARSGRTDEALAEARRLLSDPTRAVKLLVAIHERAGHPDLAVADVGKIVEQNPDRADLRLAYVDVLVRFDRFDAAQQVLRESLERQPQDRAARWRLFDIERDRRRWESAFGLVADALRMDPEIHDTARAKVQLLADDADAGALLEGLSAPTTPESTFAVEYLRGVIAQRRGHLRRASLMFFRSATAKPGFLPARIEMAEIMLDAFNWQAVIDLLSANAEQLRGDARLERLVGTAYAGLDDVAHAESHLDAAIRLNRADTEAMMTLAELLREQGDFLRAQRQYEAVLEINPLEEKAREALVELFLFKLDRPADAAAQLTELRRLSASPHRIARCAARLDVGGDPRERNWDRYRKMLVDEIDRSGPDARTEALIANSYLQQDDHAAALAHIDKAVALDPKDSDLLFAKAMIQRDVLDYAGAVETMNILLSRHPNRTNWIQRYLGVLLVDHRYAEVHDLSMRQLARADLGKDDVDTYRAAAIEALDRTKRHDERIALLTKWRDASPDEPKWAAALVIAYGDAERFDEAIALARSRYEQSRDTQDRDGLMRSLLNVLVDAKRFTEAEQFLLDELNGDPENGGLHQRLIAVLMMADRYEDALELTENLKSAFRSDDSRREETVVILTGARRYDEAINLRKKWLRELKGRTPDPDDGRVEDMQLRLANTLIQAGRIEEAVSNLRKWLDEAELPPVRFAYLTQLSICYQYREDRERAINALEQAFDLRDQVLGDDVLIHNDLGYSLADAGLRIDEAERMIRFALVRKPDNGAYLDSYGWVLYKKGDFAGAKSWLAKATETVQGKDAVVHDHLGDALWRLGAGEQAVEHWTTAIGLVQEEMKNSDRLDLRRLLDGLNAKVEAQRSGKTPEVAPLAAVAEPAAP